MHGRLGLGAASLRYLRWGNAVKILEYITSSINVLLLAVPPVKYLGLNGQICRDNYSIFLRWSNNWSRPFGLFCTFYPHDAIALAVVLQKSRLPKQTCRYTLSSYQITVPGVKWQPRFTISTYSQWLSFIPSFHHLFIYSLIHSFIHSFIYSSIHPSWGRFQPSSAFTGNHEFWPSIREITPHGNPLINHKQIPFHPIAPNRKKVKNYTTQDYSIVTLRPPLCPYGVSLMARFRAGKVPVGPAAALCISSAPSTSENAMGL